MKKKYIKSPLNYIGGKYKLLNQLIPLFPEKNDVFVDLFSGGLNIAINVNADKIVAIDTNRYIIEMFEYFRKNKIEEILSDIERIINKYDLSKTNSDGYLMLRSDYNQDKSPLYLFVLTCFSFNHQIRYNNSFEFNCPFGKNRSSYNSNIENNLIRFVSKIQSGNFTFIPEDFEYIYNLDLTKDDFVYCDPPYLITNGSYNDGNRGFGDWTIESEKKLLNLLDHLNEKGVKFALSNVFVHKGLENKLLINWSKKYIVHDIKMTYNNSNYQSTAKNHITREVLITNY